MLKCESIWCDKLNIYNPYNDPWSEKLSKNIPIFDKQAFKKFQKYNFIYDKLFVAKSQNINCGTLDSINVKDVEYPIFIKPRYGHKTSSSRNCMKIENENDLLRHINKKDMMWSEFIDEREGMVDYFIHNGKIVHQLTYIYSPEQNGSIADIWKDISPSNKPPPEIDTWVKNHLKGYNGVCNVQYRGSTIIEVGLRLARSGAYVYSTNNTKLIRALNDLVDNQNWNYKLSDTDLNFKNFFSFKCQINTPILYIFPQYVMDAIMKSNGCKEFYEYYFEPNGKGNKMVCFQFFHEDFEKGLLIKNKIEKLFNFIQTLFIIMFMISIIFILRFKNYKPMIITTSLFLTRFLNPLSTNYKMYKNNT